MKSNKKEFNHDYENVEKDEPKKVSDFMYKKDQAGNIICKMIVTCPISRDIWKSRGWVE